MVRKLVKYLLPPIGLALGLCWALSTAFRLMWQANNAAVMLGLIVLVGGVFLFLAGCNWYCGSILGFRSHEEE